MPKLIDPFFYETCHALVIFARQLIDLLDHFVNLDGAFVDFLRVQHTVKNQTQTDLGTYYCNATNPETRVSVVSNNATLELASTYTTRTPSWLVPCLM